MSELILPDAYRAQKKARHIRAFISGSHKVIESFDKKIEAFDLAADPGERQPKGLQQAEVERLRRAADQLASSLQKHVAPAKTRPLDAETRERMRDLGYAE